MLLATALALKAGQAMLDAKTLCAREGQEGRSGEGQRVSYKGRHDLCVVAGGNTATTVVACGMEDGRPAEWLLLSLLLLVRSQLLFSQTCTIFQLDSLKPIRIAKCPE